MNLILLGRCQWLSKDSSCSPAPRTVEKAWSSLIRMVCLSCRCQDLGAWWSFLGSLCLLFLNLNISLYSLYFTESCIFCLFALIHCTLISDFPYSLHIVIHLQSTISGRNIEWPHVPSPLWAQLRNSPTSCLKQAQRERKIHQMNSTQSNSLIIL